MDTEPESATRAIKELIAAQGFARVGIARAEALQPEREQLNAWLAKGHHGQMQWMQNTAEVRVDPRHENMVADAKSVVVAAFAYRRADTQLAAPGRVARYAHGRDYHRVLHKKLEPALAWFHERGRRARIAVDSKPVMERAWAERAGVGFVGKNSCLIVPGIGSFVFLACVVTDAELLADKPMQRRCGNCTACLDACPTRAFVGPRQLDARKCISYLTIEHKGDIAPDLQTKMGDWIFGCDVCQEVCPYQSSAYADNETNQSFAADERWSGLSAETLASMGEQEFDERFAGSPIRRAGHASMVRNAGIVLSNTTGRRRLPILDNLVATATDVTS